MASIARTPTIQSIITKESSRLEQVCPLDRKLTAGDDSLKSAINLLGKQNDSLVVLDLFDVKPIDGYTHQLLDSNAYLFSVSPDHKSLASIERVYSDTAFKVKLNVLTFTPEKKEHVYDLPLESVLIRWVNNSDIAIYDDNPCPGLVAWINTFTGEMTYPTNGHPKITESMCVLYPGISPEKSKIVFPWAVSSLKTDQSLEIKFDHTLSNTLPTYLTQWLDEKNLMIARWQDDKLFYGTHEFNSLTDGESIKYKFQQIQLPMLATKDTWSQPAILWPKSIRFGMDLVDSSVNLLDFLEKSAPMNFYVINPAQEQITDYCLDRNHFGNETGRLSGAFQNSFVSPDEKFIAWAVYDYETGSLLGTNVLDLQSGKILQIPDFDVLGWVNP